MRYVFNTFHVEVKGKILILGKDLTPGSNSIYEFKSRNIQKKSYLKFKILIVYISHNNIITSLTCKILTNIGSMTHVNKSTSMHCHFFTNLQALIKFFETILDRTTIHKIISSLEYQLTTSWSHQVNSSNGTRFFFFTWFIARLYTDLLFSYRKNWIVTSICDVYWKYAPSISYQKNLDTSL